MSPNIHQNSPKNGSGSRYNLRQSQILSYSAKVIAREGYEKASIRRIAAEMGMSISALYYYFSSKEELLYLIQYTSFDELVKKLDQKLENIQDPELKLFILIENHLEHFWSRISELTICSHEINTLKGDAYIKVRKIRRRYYDTALTLVEEITQNQEGSALQAPLCTLNLFGMLNWIYMWIDPAKNKSARILAEEIFNLFLNGIKSRSRSSPGKKAPAGG